MTLIWIFILNLVYIINNLDEYPNLLSDIYIYEIEK